MFGNTMNIKYMEKGKFNLRLKKNVKHVEHIAIG